MFFCNPGVSSLFWLTPAPVIISILNVVFFFFPSFAFSIVINNMQQNVGYHLDPTTLVWVKGPGYSYKTFSTNINYKDPVFNKTVKRPSDLLFTLSFLALMIIFSLLTVFTDNWFESNRGRSKSPIQLLKSLFRKSAKPRRLSEMASDCDQGKSKSNSR